MSLTMIHPKRSLLERDTRGLKNRESLEIRATQKIPGTGNEEDPEIETEIEIAEMTRGKEIENVDDHETEMIREKDADRPANEDVQENETRHRKERATDMNNDIKILRQVVVRHLIPVNFKYSPHLSFTNTNQSSVKSVEAVSSTIKSSNLIASHSRFSISIQVR